MADLEKIIKVKDIEGKYLKSKPTIKIKEERSDKKEGEIQSKKEQIVPEVKIDQTKIVIKNNEKTSAQEQDILNKKIGILKHERTYSNKHVDFNMELEYVPFDESKDYTIEIQFVDEIPKKIVSYAALYALKKEEEQQEKLKEQQKIKNKNKRHIRIKNRPKKEKIDVDCNTEHEDDPEDNITDLYEEPTEELKTIEETLRKEEIQQVLREGNSILPDVSDKATSSDDGNKITEAETGENLIKPHEGEMIIESEKSDEGSPPSDEQITQSRDGTDLEQFNLPHNEENRPMAEMNFSSKEEEAPILKLNCIGIQEKDRNKEENIKSLEVFTGSHVEEEELQLSQEISLQQNQIEQLISKSKEISEEFKSKNPSNTVKKENEENNVEPKEIDEGRDTQREHHIERYPNDNKIEGMINDTLAHTNNQKNKRDNIDRSEQLQENSATKIDGYQHSESDENSVSQKWENDSNLEASSSLTDYLTDDEEEFEFDDVLPSNSRTSYADDKSNSGVIKGITTEISDKEKLNEKNVSENIRKLDSPPLEINKNDITMKADAGQEENKKTSEEFVIRDEGASNNSRGNKCVSPICCNM